jgi:hypothetical protein
MPKCTSGELIMILYLSEIFTLDLHFIFNFYCFPNLVLRHRTSGRTLECIGCLFIFICISHVLVARF